MPEFATEDVDSAVTARTIKTLVTPRPIAWVSTVDAEGRENLAPFSAYNYISQSPPVLMFSSSKRGDRYKDSAENARDTGEFAVNVVTERLAQTMDTTSKDLPPGESEFEYADVERADCVAIDAPRVADAAATLECRHHDSLEIAGRLVTFGEVVYAHVDDDLLVDGKIDSRKVDTVGRLGGPFYTVSDPIEFERQF